MAIFTGTARWAKLQEPDTKFEPVYTIDLIMDDAEKAKLEALIEEAVEEAGPKAKVKTPKVKKDEETGNWVFRFRQKYLDHHGDPRPPIVVVDSNKEPLDKLVGNGSQVRVLANVRYIENKYGKFVGVYLSKVQVLELVEWGGGEDFDDVAEYEGDQKDSSGSEEDF